MKMTGLTQVEKIDLLRELLFKAIGNNEQQLVMLYLELGAPLEAISTEMRKSAKLTPLLFAVRNKRYEIAEYLLSRGANIDARNSSGLTALHIASNFSNQPPLVKLLLDHGAEINVKSTSDITPIMLAAGYGDIDSYSPETFALLSESGANISAETVKELIDRHEKIDEHREIISILRSYQEQQKLAMSINFNADKGQSILEF